jgi:DNA repair protein SbcC/Rad50
MAYERHVHLTAEMEKLDAQYPHYLSTLSERSVLENLAARVDEYEAAIEKAHHLQLEHLSDAEVADADAGEVSDRIAQMEEDVEGARLEYNSASGESAHYAALFEQCANSLDELADNSICPTCRQPIDDVGAIRESIAEEASLYAQRRDESAAHAADMNAHINDTTVKIARLRHELRLSENEATAARNNAARLQREEEDLLLKLGAAVDAARALRENDYAHAAREKCVGYDPGQHALVREMLRAIPTAVQDYTRLQTARERIAAVEVEQVIKHGEQEVIRQQYNVTVADKNEAEDRYNLLGDPEPIAEALADNEAELKKLEAYHNSTIADYTRAQEDELRHRKLQRSIAETDDKLAAAESELRTAQLLVKASGKGGAQALLIEAALPQIETDANDYLAHMAPGTRLTLESQRETKSGSVSETLDIGVWRDGFAAPIETLSGGERFRADLALRLAIGKFLARRSGTQVRFLAIDEGISALDNDGIESVMETIFSLRGLFDLILVITHIREIQEFFSVAGFAIRVNKIDGRSTIGIQ